MKRTYKAFLTQTGTNAPTADIVDNTFCGTPVWDYISTGYYSLTLTGAFTGKVSVKFGNEGDTEISALYLQGDKTNDSIQIFVSQVANVGNGNDNCLHETFIEIEVYN